MQKKEILTAGASMLLVFLGILHVVLPRQVIGFTISSNMVYDVLLSLMCIFLLYRYYDQLHQDSWSYGVLLFALLLHNFGLYPTSPLGIRFDHYMHFVGGFAIALVVDRLFSKERWGKLQRFIVIVVFTLGVGAIGEVVEWLGYAIYGAGDGFLFYGAGDEGEWRNASLDMIFNLFGSLVVATWRCVRLK